jgi:type I restriction enzyme, S subunit
MSELYELPDGWKWKELKSFGKFIRGVSYKKEQLLESKKENDLILLRANNIQNELNLDEVQIIPKEVAKGKILEDGDVLFAMSSGSKHLVGKNILINGLTDYTFGAFCSVYRNTKKEILDNYYLSYVLKSNLYREKLSALSMGANINNLKSSDLEIIKIPTPPLSEQQRIVSKLDLLFEKIDKSIALHQKNMDEANAFMGSILNDVFGELEEKYEKFSINTVATIKGGKRVPKGYKLSEKPTPYPYLRVTDFKDYGTICTGKMLYLTKDRPMKLLPKQ